MKIVLNILTILLLVLVAGLFFFILGVMFMPDHITEPYMKEIAFTGVGLFFAMALDAFLLLTILVLTEK